MVKINPDGNFEYYMDGYVKSNMDVAIEAAKNDFDCIFAIDGIEGSGKSTFAMQLAKYVDPTFTVDRVVYSAEAFEKAVLSCEKKQAVCFDEAFAGMNSRSVMSNVNKKLINLIMRIRQRNLFIFLVIPSFFELEKYMAIHRTIALFHVYTKGFDRGYVYFYSRNKKQDLYIMGKQEMKYCIKPDFFGRFTSAMPIDVVAYKKKKEATIGEYMAEKNKDTTAATEEKMRMREDAREDALVNLIFKLKRLKIMKDKEIADSMGMGVKVMQNILARWKVRHRIEIDPKEIAKELDKPEDSAVEK